jgi:GTP-binding protein
MLIDSVKVYVKAGRGGKGCRSFYRDKYTRYGIPNGGDGGDGADIVIQADFHLLTLLDFQYNRHFSGTAGGNASSKNKKGRNAESLVIRVPVGTTVKDAKTGCFLRDLDKDGEALVVARGGKGGLGNKLHPEATDGEPGEEKELLFDLKLIADVGVVGFPNAGKSTFVSAVSNAHPKIAHYPFTTKSPVLGVVQRDTINFVIADIPGLIEGSSQGRGLGDKFLRHVERTKILVHLVDMSASEGRNPIEDYRVINNELKRYGSNVIKKKQVLVANKMDLEGAEKNLAKFKVSVKKKIFPVSALHREGVEAVIEAIAKKL